MAVIREDARKRTNRLAEDMGWDERTAAGAMQFVWDESQERGLATATADQLCRWALVRDAEERMRFVDALQKEGVGFVELQVDGTYLIAGNPAAITSRRNGRQQRRDAAKSLWDKRRSGELPPPRPRQNGEDDAARIASRNAARIAARDAARNATSFARIKNESGDNSGFCSNDEQKPGDNSPNDAGRIAVRNAARNAGKGVSNTEDTPPIKKGGLSYEVDPREPEPADEVVLEREPTPAELAAVIDEPAVSDVRTAPTGDNETVAKWAAARVAAEMLRKEFPAPDGWRRIGEWSEADRVAANRELERRLADPSGQAMLLVLAVYPQGALELLAAIVADKGAQRYFERDLAKKFAAFLAVARKSPPPRSLHQVGARA